ncbi:MAG: AAA family ATPase [Acholeplasmataceae bacterium]
MILNIKNYKCIDHVELDIEKNKINVLYGITGSGKSSVAEALIADEISVYGIPYGKTIAEVEIIKSDFNNIPIELYDRNKLNEVIFQRDSDGIYSIIFDEDKTIEKLNSELREILILPPDINNAIHELLDEYDSFVKDIYKTKGKDKNLTLSSTSSLVKIQKSLTEIEKEHPTFNYKGIDHLKWIQTGINKNYQHEPYCPYCMQPISEDSKILLDDIKKMDTNAINKVYNNNDKMFKKLDIDIDEVIKDNKILIDSMMLIEPIILDLKHVLHTVNLNNREIASISELNLSETTYDAITNLKEFCLKFNNQVQELKRKRGKLIEESQKIIAAIKKEINQALETLMINYRFDFNSDTIDYEKMKCDYKLIHQDYINTKISLEYNLSEGEKNLIALLLFILQNADKEKLLILDDPISSTDEQRRKSILEILKENSKNKTILILTHDQIFVKTLAFDNQNGDEKFVGLLTHIASTKNNDTNEIRFEDLTTIRNHALSSLNESSSYFSKIIAIRFAAEYDKNNSITDEEQVYKDIYKFISGLYKLQVDEINEEKYLSSLSDFNYIESDIVNKIKEIYEVNLDEIFSSRKQTISVSNLNLIDKVFYYRFKGNAHKKIKKEIDSWIHLTDAQVITLNPYKFNPFTKTINDFLESNEN